MSSPLFYRYFHANTPKTNNINDKMYMPNIKLTIKLVVINVKIATKIMSSHQNNLVAVVSFILFLSCLHSNLTFLNFLLIKSFKNYTTFNPNPYLLKPTMDYNVLHHILPLLIREPSAKLLFHQF